MCRNIKRLFNFDPPATDAEIHEAALQYVRKVSGYRMPSVANEDAFFVAVRDVEAATKELLDQLVTTATPHTREEEAARAKARAEKRFGPR